MPYITITDVISPPDAPADGASLYSALGKLYYVNDDEVTHEIATDSNLPFVADITQTMLANDSVGTDQLIDNNVTAAKIAVNVVGATYNAGTDLTLKGASDRIGAAASSSGSIATSIDTDGTLKAGAVDVAAVLAAGVVTGAKLSAQATPAENLCFDPFNIYLAPGAQWASKSRWYQYSALSKIDPDAANPYGCPTMRHLGSEATITGKVLWLNDVAIDGVSTLVLRVKIPTGTSARAYARYFTSGGTALGIDNVGTTTAGDDTTKALTASIETPPANAAYLVVGLNRTTGSGDCDIYAWHVARGEYAGTLIGREAVFTYLRQEIIDARGASASIDARLDAIEAAALVEGLSSYTDFYGAHLLRSYAAKRALINYGTTAQIRIVCLGDSWTQGIAGALRNSLQTQYGNAGAGFMQFQDGYATIGDGTLAFAGTWTYEETTAAYGLGFQSVLSTDAATPAKVTVTVPATSLIIHYGKQPTGGTFRYRVDSGSWTTVDTNAAAAYATVPISGLSNASHTLEIEVLTAGSAGVRLVGVDAQIAVKGVNVSWCGHAGAKAIDYIALDGAAFAAALVAHSPDTVTLQLGINDYGYYPYTTWTTQMNTLIDRIQAAVPLTDILLIAQPDVGAARTWPMSDYAEAVRDIAVAQGCTMLDLYKNWGPYAGGNARGLYVNTTHPNPSGYQLIADLLLDRLQL
jgi:hypothetical protein